MTGTTEGEAPFAEQRLVMEQAGLRSDRVRSVVRHDGGWLATVFVSSSDLEP